MINKMNHIKIYIHILYVGNISCRLYFFKITLNQNYFLKIGCDIENQGIYGNGGKLRIMNGDGHRLELLLERLDSMLDEIKRVEK